MKQQHSKKVSRRVAGLIVIGLISLLISSVVAEPWLSNRFAQNCAACHAPGRYNKEPVGRRCTLSCQGCHVNPNGGGMRNQYGIWVQERWLKSWDQNFIGGSKPAPAPVKDQPYMRVAKAAAEREAQGQSVPELKRTPPMATISVVDPPESLYDKESYDEWHTNVSEEVFRYTIPSFDPYLLERSLGIYASGGFRYLMGQQDGEHIPDNRKSFAFPMAFDMGLRMRPLKYHEFSIVTEARFGNNALGTQLEQTFTTSARVKSAYLLVDDLAYNTYVQAGLQRPLFGHYTPDHTALSQRVARLDQNSVYKTFGVGTAPNVPFGIFNFISPMADQNYAQDEGFVTTLGGRFVTYSASVMFSYWNTKAPNNAGVPVQREMMSFNLGGMYNRFIANLDLLWVKRERDNDLGKFDAGSVTTLETKYRLWRENYALVNFAMGNTHPSLSRGSAQEIMIGAKSFPISGTEFELLYIQREDKLNSDVTKNNILQLQAHLFF